MKSLKFLILHGSFNGPQERWLSWLEKELKKLRNDVIFPQFPVENWDVLTKQGENYACQKQSVETWLEELKLHIEKDEDSEYVVIGHSTGPAFSLHAIQKFNLNVKLAIWVAPFMEKLNKAWQTDLVNQSFVNRSLLDMNKLNSLIQNSVIVYSDNDKYVDTEYSLNFAALFNSEIFLIENGGHLNNSAGFDEFPLILDLIKNE